MKEHQLFFVHKIDRDHHLRVTQSICVRKKGKLLQTPIINKDLTIST